MRICLVALVLAVGASSCTPMCDLSTCDGCCDAKGVCVTGRDVQACGRSGEACQVCASERTCQSGFCAQPPLEPFDAGLDAGQVQQLVPSLDGGTSFDVWVREYCEPFFAARQNEATRCGYGTRQALEADLDRDLEHCRRQYSRSMAEGRIALDVAQARVCFAFAATAECDLYGLARAQACPDLFLGRVPENGACFDQECAPGFWCDLNDQCPGRCVRNIPLGGTVPANNWARCVDGAYFTFLDRICVPVLRLGATCAEDWTCEPGTHCPANECVERRAVDAGMPCGFKAVCAASATCEQGTCVARRQEGQACGAPDQPCAVGLSCDAGTCERKPTLDAGAPCSAENSQCVRGTFCNGPYLADAGWTLLPGVCEPTRGLGGACTHAAALFLECEPGLSCSVAPPARPGAGTCVVRSTLGSSCTFGEFSTQCEDRLFCSASAPAMSGVCLLRKAEDELCTRHDECCINGRCARVPCIAEWNLR